MSKPNRLQAAFERGLAPRGDLSRELKELGEFEVASKSDGEVLARSVANFAKCPVDTDEPAAAFYEVTRLFQAVTSADAFRHLALNGIPSLIDAYDGRLNEPSKYESGLLFALKIFARYGTVDGLDRVVDAAFNTALDDGYLWSVILEQIGDTDPLIPDLIRRLSRPLPDRLACVALLNWVNRLLRENIVSSHPFNSPDGIERLRSWLTDGREESFSFAHSAAASLPFIGDPPRSELLALAMDHAEVGVQMEAAWASARLGSEAGRKFLARMCLDRDRSMTARAYLLDLGLEDAIPEEADDPDFTALAAMCDWLMYPQEFGRPPDDIELYDTREMFWPPTNDWRPLWIFKYLYRAENENESDTTGVGMAGSITSSLYDETSIDMPPEDIYALHCCWEMEANEDPRTPAQRSIDAGRALIEAAQKDDLEDDEKF